MLVLAGLLSVWSPVQMPGLGVIPAAHAAEDDAMHRVQLMLKKLRSAMSSLKDLDELEKAGMPKKDVDRMRRAMNSKIQDMINETLLNIKRL
ncbi:MAG: hypothetical protein D6717_07010 [Gammaproteobacteria bacterium]|nr:MAG: hypothetical protein D6717_07010 [Gammaproteobacteria bacterium]